MADFANFSFTTQETWYGEISFLNGDADNAPLSLAGRSFEMLVTPAGQGGSLLEPARTLTMAQGGGLSFKTGGTDTLLFRVDRDIARRDFARIEYTADILEVVDGERHLFMPVRVRYSEPSGLISFVPRLVGVSVTFSARRQPIITPVAITGRQGIPGATIVTGSAPPTSTTGRDGDFFIETRSDPKLPRRMYGPKVGSTWPAGPWDIEFTGSVQATNADSLRALSDYLGEAYNARNFGASGLPFRDQSAALLAWIARWRTAGTTPYSAQLPATGAKDLFIPAGTYQYAPTGDPTKDVLTTAGTGSTIRGVGYASVLSGIGVKLQHFRSQVKDLILSGVSPTGIEFTDDAGANRRLGNAAGVLVRDKTGYAFVFRGTGGFDSATDCKSEKCYGGVDVQDTVGTQITAFDGIGSEGQKGAGIRLAGGGETKILGSKLIGYAINALFEGSRRKLCVEHYANNLTATRAQRIAHPVTAWTSAGTGLVTLTLRKKINCWVRNRGCVLTQDAISGEVYTWITIGRGNDEATVGVGSGGSGASIASYKVGGVELLNGPVPYTTTGTGIVANRVGTAGAVAASINEGTATHGYRAEARGAIVFVIASDGSAAIGRAAAIVTTDGGLNVLLPNYVALELSEAHGLAVNDDLEFSAAPYAGEHEIRIVESASVIVAEMPYASDQFGQAWVPHRYTPGDPEVLIAGSGSAYDNVVVNVVAVQDNTITVEADIARFPASPPASGANVSTMGWDVVFAARSGNSGTLNDMFVDDGNYNRVLFKSVYNVWMTGRLKQKIYFCRRANKDFTSDMVRLGGTARGRMFDPFAPVPVGGEKTGWSRHSMKPGGLNTAAGRSYVSEEMPASGLPAINDIPQTIERRIYQDRIEHWIGDTLMERVNAAGVTMPGVVAGIAGFVVSQVATFTAALTLKDTLTVEGAVSCKAGLTVDGATAFAQGAVRVEATTFTADGTWTKPAWAKRVHAVMTGGGGGGGSGRRGAANSVRRGGGGGGAGAHNVEGWFARDLTATLSILVGTAGPGGAAPAGDDANGNPGAAGGSSFVRLGNGNAIATAAGGGPGGAGTATAGTAGTAGSNQSKGSVGAGGVGSIGAATGGAGGNGIEGAGGGGGGGGLSAANAAQAGGAGGFGYMLGGALQRAASVAGGAVGAAGTAGLAAVITTWKRGFGSGGGGGGAGSGAAGGAGGVGGAAGAGGGGGGAAPNGFLPGAGGDGARGEVTIIAEG